MSHTRIQTPNLEWPPCETCFLKFLAHRDGIGEGDVGERPNGSSPTSSSSNSTSMISLLDGSPMLYLHNDFCIITALNVLKSAISFLRRLSSIVWGLPKIRFLFWSSSTDAIKSFSIAVSCGADSVCLSWHAGRQIFKREHLAVSLASFSMCCCNFDIP